MKDQTIIKLCELRGMLGAQRDIYESAADLYGRLADDDEEGYERGYIQGLIRAYKEAAVKAQRSLEQLNEIMEEIGYA